MGGCKPDFPTFQLLDEVRGIGIDFERDGKIDVVVGRNDEGIFWKMPVKYQLVMFKFLYEGHHQKSTLRILENLQMPGFMDDTYTVFDPEGNVTEIYRPGSGLKSTEFSTGLEPVA